MIKRARGADGVRVTFMLETDAAVSVVGDFNGWDPTVHQLRRRSNGKRSVTVLMDPGSVVSFRYLAEGGRFFDDADADRFEDNGYGGSHGVLVLPPAARSAAAPAARSAGAPAAPSTNGTSPRRKLASKPAPKR